MICTWLIDSDQFESAQVLDARVSHYFKQSAMISTRPSGQSGVLWREEDGQEPQLQVSGSGDSVSGERRLRISEFEAIKQVLMCVNPRVGMWGTTRL